MARLTRAEYAARHGPTTRDRIRLEDTNLFARVERDETSYGDELLRGWAKTLRTGIIRDQPTAESELDHRDNTIGADPVLGIVKANIGGRTAASWESAGWGTWTSSTTPTFSSAPTRCPSMSARTSRRPRG